MLITNNDDMLIKVNEYIYIYIEWRYGDND